ncbi:response regulator transcription factor [Chitinophaga sp. Cy-1792]|uniref:response regulator transcription factor n=1 Tax=Chitinophaga sp. Cy-1792 TaxID=2608339 RepID=UPI0014213DE5|nr:response regulator transcription factor [Chitinophaga sp. Cy-1792]NIG54219.1 response regulator [Chitinophaga sp. Cy-1792]
MSKKILLVEDDEVMPKIIARILPEPDFVVDVAVNGKEAMEKLEGSNYNYDLIITDIMMPYANGFEILSKVKSHNPGNPIPVIIVSNAGNEDMIMEGFKLGVDDFLKKPIIPAELILRVKRLLMKK